MDDAMEVDIPDLTQQVQITNYAPEFSGTYSSIHRGILHGELVAVKVIRPLSVSLHTMRRKVQRERVVWTRLKHENIAPLYGYTEANMFFGPFGALISPWYHYGDADKFFNENRHILTMDQRKGLWYGVVAGVCYLHSQAPPIVHGDLKPGNILIDDYGVAKICDFGLVHILMRKDGHSGMTTTSAHTGTARYLPYELVTSQSVEQLTEASDVYSMGCVGLFILFSQIPYAHRMNNNFGDIFRDIVDGTPPAINPAEISPRDAQIWLILESCWGTAPSTRASALWVLEALRNYSTPPSTNYFSAGNPTLLPQSLISNGVEGLLGADTSPRANVGQQPVTTPVTSKASEGQKKRNVRFICSNHGCGRMSTSYYDVNIHLRSHHEAQPIQPFKCKWPGCEKSFARHGDRSLHQTLHLNLSPYTCNDAKLHVPKWTF
ncbi:kinase-like protein [Serendipita vermifera]|nr:kinase-like protein [Serendipita vermifera]